MYHNFIRYYGGDFLVVILIYCFIKTFIPLKSILAAIFVLLFSYLVLLFSYLIEILQYYHFVKLVGKQNSNMALKILCNSISFIDLRVYTLGSISVLIFEWVLKNIINLIRFEVKEKQKY
jgi:hypothetical protein